MAKSSYYAGGKNGSLDGAPIWRPTWWGELGNDREFLEATRPRTAFKAPYYGGGYRKVIDGIPTRLAAHVADWKPANKAALYQGSATRKELEQAAAQANILFSSDNSAQVTA